MKTTSIRCFRMAFQAALSLVAILHSAVAATVDVTYDDLHRVTQVTDSAPYSVAYTYDEVGNRVLRVSSTTNAGAPIAVTDTAAFSSQTEAVLSAAVNPNGASTMAWMEWGTDTNYGNSTTHQSVGSGSLTVNTTAPITGLSLETTYHFRVVAQNAAGITYGQDETFKTIDLNFTYTTGSEVPLIVNGFTATGRTINLALNYAPPTGTELMVVKNTALGFINGTFNGLAHGQTVALSFGGKTFNFVANYYGGTGNDLVLVWANNRTFATGWNGYGQIGDNTLTHRAAPVPVTSSGVLAGKTIIALSAGSYHSLALCSDGTVAAWGNNFYGQLGDNSTTDRSAPVAVTTTGTALEGKTVVAVAAGAIHSLALCSDGTAASWGSNGYGQLGDNTTLQQKAPVAVVTAGTALAGKQVSTIAAGAYHSLALCSDGTVAGWGNNYNGQLGDGTTTTSSPYGRLTPVAVTTTGTALAAKQVVTIAAGAHHSLALCSDGTLAAWGYNGYGALGDTTTADRSMAVSVAMIGTVFTGKQVVTIAAGRYHSLGLCSDGTLGAWGYNYQGQLGDGTMTTSSPYGRATPVAVSTTGTGLAGKQVVTIAAGAYHSLARCADGTVAAWGSNVEGALGDATTADRSTPVTVQTIGLGAGEQFTGVSSGAFAYHTLAIVASPQDSVPEIAVFDGNGVNGPQRQNGVGGFGFPNTPVGANSISQTFTIKNTGSADLSGVSVTKATFGDAGDFTIGDPGATTLPPGTTTTFSVTFSPTAVGGRSVVLRIVSNDSDENPFVIPVFGNGPPAIVVEQPVGTTLNDGLRTISFGSVLSGSFNSLTFTIRNVGAGDLTGLGISFDGVNPADFTVTASPVPPLVAGNSTSFTVRFSPTSVGVKTATLHIASNDAGAHPFDVNMTGIAVPAMPITGTGTGMKTTGNIFPAGEVDYYSFTAQAGDRVYAAVTTSFTVSAPGAGRTVMSTGLNLETQDAQGRA
ncbi:MAG: choice-of-anchor D domain-containing protein, partial [Fimbriimonadaceae bacterium]